MISAVRISGALILLFLTAALGALEVPPLTGRVVDRAGIFGSGGSVRIEDAIRKLERATGGQMAVLTVKTLDGTPLEEFGIAVMDQWKIGQKDKDNGAILIIAADDRKLRLEVGYGWEGSINDARAGDVIRGIGPFFRENRYADGAVYAVGKVQEFIAEKATEPLGKNRENITKQIGAWGVFFVVLFIFIILGISDRFSGGSGGGRGSGGRGHGGFGGFGGGGFGGGRGGFGGGGFGGGGGRGGGGGASGGW